MAIERIRAKLSDIFFVIVKKLRFSKKLSSIITSVNVLG